MSIVQKIGSEVVSLRRTILTIKVLFGNVIEAEDPDR